MDIFCPIDVGQALSCQSEPRILQNDVALSAANDLEAQPTNQSCKNRHPTSKQACEHFTVGFQTFISVPSSAPFISDVHHNQGPFQEHSDYIAHYPRLEPLR